MLKLAGLLHACCCFCETGDQRAIAVKSVIPWAVMAVGHLLCHHDFDDCTFMIAWMSPSLRSGFT